MDWKMVALIGGLVMIFLLFGRNPTVIATQTKSLSIEEQIKAQLESEGM